MQVEGNSVTIYGLVYKNGSANINICLNASTSTQYNLVCTTFSQNSKTTVVASPVVLYGLGSGTHEIYLENRDPGKLFLFDGIRPQ